MHILVVRLSPISSVKARTDTAKHEISFYGNFLSVRHPFRDMRDISVYLKILFKYLTALLKEDENLIVIVSMRSVVSVVLGQIARVIWLR